MDGILIINKPKECTSHDIVFKIKKILDEKVGHTGTLDPMATGVLPLLIGKGTLCSKYLVNHDKKYKVEITLGKRTDTADQEGKVIEEKEVPIKIFEDNIELEKIIKTFIGEQEQIPPIYSAIKVKGKKLYEYARKGIDVKIEPRTIEIYDIKLLETCKENKTITCEVSCSKGTYIRSLSEDIAKKLNTIGYMSNLQRQQVGEFKIENSYEIKDIKKIYEGEEKETLKKELETKIITIEEIFKKKEKIELNDKKLELFLNGVKLKNINKDEIYRIYNNEKFIGIGTIKDNLLKRDIIL